MRKALIVTAMFLLALPASAAELPPGGTFTDDDGSVHEGAIEAISDEGITVGCAPDRYCPELPVTRAQMASFLARALDLPVTSQDSRFSDDDTSIHEGDIEAIAGAGITFGCTPLQFCPDDSVTRAQMASFLTRAFHLPSSSGTDRFVDDDGIVHEGDIEALAAAGITVGCAPDRYCPELPVTRAQMASFLTRALDLAPIVPPPGFFADVRPIGPALAARMEPSSWRPGCPVPLDDLRYVELDFWGFDGREHRGELVVHDEWTDEIIEVFSTLFDERFPVRRMRLVDDYGGDDGASMDANNTSAFNCRTAAGSSSWSQHAFGRAIDINPVQNPYVRGPSVLPEAGRSYVDRSQGAPGMIKDGEAVVAAFDAIGWGWGGHWTGSKDWHHFSANGR